MLTRKAGTDQGRRTLYENAAHLSRVRWGVGKRANLMGGRQNPTANTTSDQMLIQKKTSIQ